MGVLFHLTDEIDPLMASVICINYIKAIKSCKLPSTVENELHITSMNDNNVSPGSGGNISSQLCSTFSILANNYFGMDGKKKSDTSVAERFQELESIKSFIITRAYEEKK